MQSSAADRSLNKRALMVHDGLAFLALLGTSVALFGVTLFLFRSFAAHREDLGTIWSGRGRTAFEQRRPEEAVRALEIALSYAPDNEPDQLMLAQALAGTGHTEEATNYFLDLWEERPGDGLINLQLARLAARRGDAAEAIERYGAAISGSWEGDALARRREVRLELADFLTERGRFSDARQDLLALAGDAPLDVDLTLLVARKFAAAGDRADAQAFEERAQRMLELAAAPPRSAPNGR